ncbi:class III extradiol dioxygenase subunit B-like domain-containing protein [Streptomyces sp. RS10V-4]|uniref:class III extradiol dioxygenase subunit B-like domain-containing protein n=1 Tax=Streptomyces rhizoryzae TaxID=2932493 RepID=UPI002004BF9A|nr:class III extradiol dioxygenase subunit B-like domain-containing protein [Streptomyces rhizoryzae]MCK7626141.1 class III extradiol dioxygenase subunit B-like domain-containing protein [Streptomyces rhizoryzae]
MLVAAALCPCPPLLVPEVAAGAAPELEPVRAACLDAVGVLAAARPDRLIVLGPARAEAGAQRHPQGAPGTFRDFGVALDVTLGPAGPEPAERPTGPRLPASLAVGAWLLSRTQWSDAPVEGVAVGERLPADRCLPLGRELAAAAPRVALLVLGDGSARRSVKAPGYFDERAEAFDTAAFRALGGADTAALAALDEELAAALLVSGRSCWQVAAGAAEDAGLRGQLLGEDAPYGVGYAVAAWS